MACFCTLVMQAQEVKSVSLDSIPKASLPKEGMSLEYSRPSLGGFPVLQGKSYYSESNAPWMSEEGKPLEIAPNAIPHISLPSPNLGTMVVYSSSIQVNDWLTVGFYGQYVPTKTSDPRSVIMSPFNPKSSYGGFMEVMFNQHWGIGAKMGREFAPQKNGKWGWKNTTEVYPIFRK